MQRHRVVSDFLARLLPARQLQFDLFIREDECALQRVAQLAHVAGPRVRAQRLHCLHRQTLARAVPCVQPVDDLQRDVADVVPALPQRGHVQRDRRDPVEEILAQPAAAHGLHGVVMGGGDDPHVERNRFVTADAHDRVRLERAQQFHLQFGRHFRDFVEKQRAAARGFEHAHMLCNGAGEAAFFMSEQMGFRDVLRNRTAIDGHERPAPARAHVVDESRDDVLAGAAFADHQHAHACRGDARYFQQQVLNRLRAAEQSRAVIVGFRHE